VASTERVAGREILRWVVLQADMSCFIDLGIGCLTIELT
jgi:hypothetical protein